MELLFYSADNISFDKVLNHKIKKYKTLVSLENYMLKMRKKCILFIDMKLLETNIKNKEFKILKKNEIDIINKKMKKIIMYTNTMEECEIITKLAHIFNIELCYTKELESIILRELGNNGDNKNHIKINKEIIYVDYIKYVEHFKGNSHFKTAKRKIKTRVSLKEIEQKIHSEKFIRINQSIIVNKDFIKEIEGNKVIMDDDNIFYIARDKKNKILRYLI